MLTIAKCICGYIPIYVLEICVQKHKRDSVVIATRRSRFKLRFLVLYLRHENLKGFNSFTRYQQVEYLKLRHLKYLSQFTKYEGDIKALYERSLQKIIRQHVSSPGPPKNHQSVTKIVCVLITKTLEKKTEQL